MPCTLPVAVASTWKILLAPPPTPRPAGGVAGGDGACAPARPATAALAAIAAPPISTALRLEFGCSWVMPALPARSLKPRGARLAALPPVDPSLGLAAVCGQR